MYKLTLFLGLFLLITSCSSINNFQLYKTEAPNLKVDNGLLVFEDSVCSISYNLWSKNGNPTFLFYNKSDHLISIDLTECFFVLNGISYDYFQNRTYTHSSGTSRTVGNVVSSGNTNSTTTSTNSANSYFSQLSTNSKGKSSTQSLSSTQSSMSSTTTSVGYSVSYAEKDVVKIPSKSGKIISEFSIISNRFRHQDLLKYTDLGEIDSMQFTNETSPFVFLNTITYKFDPMLNSKKTVQNSFYVSTILNMHEEQFYYADYAETFGKKDDFKSLFYKYKSPLNFYLPY
jgi:hypothetical protein